MVRTFFSSAIGTILLSSVVLLGASKCAAQDTSQPTTPASSHIDAPEGTNPPEPTAKRIFGIIPNYRTSPSLDHYQPLTAAQKFKIGTQDATDRGTFVLAAAFGGLAQYNRSDPSFGNGAQAYGHYLGTSLADYVIADYMTESIYPSLLHQDPRYFRRKTGSTFSRLGYAAGQIFITHGDNGQTQVNYSELVGNATAVAISQTYYPDNRDVKDAVTSWGTQIGVDMASNVLKEFASDIYRKFSRKH